MANTQGVSFLHEFDLGNRNVNNPGVNIISVTSTAEGDFDKANLTTESLRHVWRSEDILSYQEIVIQAELKSKIDTFAILGHNLSDEAVIEIQANVDNNFVAPPFSISVPWSEDNIVSTNPFNDDYEFYKIRILDPTNACGFLEIGRIVGGRAFTLSNNEDITDDFEITLEDMADTMKTEGYFRVSNEKIKARNLSIKLNRLYTVPGMDANFQGLKRMFRKVGITRPILVILDRGDPSFCSMWAQIDKLPAENYSVNRFVSQSFRLSEVF